MLYIYIYIT
jgi:hypothetical protein